MASRPRIDVSADFESLAHRVAQWVTDLACATPGRFAIALSGGSTPKRLYQLLAATPLREAMPWERVHLFWGDDRFVPWDHPDSNYGMAHQAMIAHVPIPPENVHGIPYAGSPADAARAYEQVLKSYYGGDTLDPTRPLLDVNLLGMGPDGHTASLFPGKPALGGAASLGRRGPRTRTQSAGSARHAELSGAQQQQIGRLCRGRGREGGDDPSCPGRRPEFAVGADIARRRAGVVRRPRRAWRGLEPVDRPGDHPVIETN